jgi:hypothetical protein
LCGVELSANGVVDLTDVSIGKHCNSFRRGLITAHEYPADRGKKKEDILVQILLDQPNDDDAIAEVLDARIGLHGIPFC